MQLVCFNKCVCMCLCVCVFTSDRQVPGAVGFAQVVLSKAGVFPFVCPADVVDPQDAVWSYGDSEETVGYGG